MSPTIKVKETHDYITVTFPKGTFTISQRGYKSGGELALNTNSKILDGIIKFVESHKTFGEAAKALQSVDVMNKLWPGWDKVVGFEIGDVVTHRMRPQYGKGTVIEKKSRSYIVNFVNAGRIDIDPALIQK